MIKKIYIVDQIQDIWNLTSKLHDGQKYGGEKKGEQVEYLSHIGNVAFEIVFAIKEGSEFDFDLALKCAILHDTIEDTDISYEKIKVKFGEVVADGVLALTKDETLSNKKEMMIDSLKRIKKQPKEIWCVKMADRISNLYAPPFYWNNKKILSYIDESKLIYQKLKDGDKYLADRLQYRIERYQQFVKK